MLWRILRPRTKFPDVRCHERELAIGRGWPAARHTSRNLDFAALPPSTAVGLPLTGNRAVPRWHERAVVTAPCENPALHMRIPALCQNNVAINRQNTYPMWPVPAMQESRIRSCAKDELKTAV